MKKSAYPAILLSLSVLALAGCGKKEPVNEVPQTKTMEMPIAPSAPTDKVAAHQATGVVKQADPDKGTIVVQHEPVKSLNWPTMTMRFTVKDKVLFDKLAADKKVDFEFTQQGNEYVVTAVK